MFNPLVSIIITTHKRSDYLKRAINSVLNQTYENFEIIVVDDNNHDNYRKKTQGTLAEFIKSKKIIYIKHNFNKGISAARNTGIKYAKGQYIAFLDDDDEFYPQKIFEQIKIFKNSSNKVGLVYGAYLEINVDNGKKRVVNPKIKNDVSSILGLNHIGPPSMVMFSRDAIEKTGEFDLNLNHKEDIDYYLRISDNFEVSYTKEVITKYYIHEGGSSKNNKDRLIKMLKYIEKYKIKFKNPRIRCSEILERVGELYVLNNNKKDAIFYFLKAYLERPLKFRIVIKIILMLFK